MTTRILLAPAPPAVRPRQSRRSPSIVAVIAVLVVAASPRVDAQPADSDPPTDVTPTRKKLTGVVAEMEPVVRPDAEKVTLHGYALEPADMEVELRKTQGILSRLARGTTRTFGGTPAALPIDVRPHDDAYYVVTSSIAQKEDVRAAVEQVGGRIVEATSGAWVVSMDGAQAEQLAELQTQAGTVPETVWVGRYAPEFKRTPALDQHLEYLKDKAAPTPQPGGQVPALPPDLVTEIPADEDAEEDDDPSDAFDMPTDLGDDAVRLIPVNIYLFPGEQAANTVGLLERMGVEDVEAGEAAGNVVIRASVPAESIDQITQIEAVQAIDPFVLPTTRNDVAAQIIGVANPTPFQGDNQVVGHADSGLDIGANDQNLHEAFRGHLRQAFALGRNGDWSDWGGHGTHTAGSIVGSGSMFRGIAPQAELVHQSLGDATGGLGGIPPNYGTLFDQAYNEGARVHSDSWGLPIRLVPHLARKYLNGRQVDQWSWNNGAVRDMLIVIANGNDGTLGVGSPATAKNALSVGATETLRPTFGYDNADNPDDSASFSSVGPTEDGRIKPDIVAPGTWIASARTQAEQVPWSSNVENLNEWGTTQGFTWSTAAALSGTHSWHSSHAAGEIFTDIVRTTQFDTHGIGSLLVRFSILGNSGSNNRLCVAARQGSNSWIPVDCVPETSHQNWRSYSVALPDSLLSTANVEVAIFLFNDNPSAEDVNLFVDDVSVTSFGCWGTIGNQELDVPGGPGDRLYTLCGGTSMATPIVAGAAAVVRESLIDAGEAAPSAELIKAILINSANAIGGARPNNETGWGRLDLLAAFGTPQLYDHTMSLDDGQQASYDFQIVDPGTPLRVTLVWADPPAEQLVNDLDLVLRGPGEHPQTAACETTLAPDVVNNVESREVASPATGPWKADVCATDIESGPQPFAIVISGGIQ